MTPESIEGSTRTPHIGKIVEGRWYLDVRQTITLAEIRSLTKALPLEILSVFDRDGVLLFAPTIGERGFLDIGSFLGRLRARIVSHNHPQGGMLSDDDLRAAIGCDMARIEAVLPDGTGLAWNRPSSGWPEEKAALRAYVTGYNRAVAEVRSQGGRNVTRDAFRAEVLRQVDRALGSETRFGASAVRIERFRVE